MARRWSRRVTRQLYVLAPLVGAGVAAFVHTGLTRLAGERTTTAVPAATSAG